MRFEHDPELTTERIEEPAMRVWRSSVHPRARGTSKARGGWNAPGEVIDGSVRVGRWPSDSLSLVVIWFDGSTGLPALLDLG